MREVALVWVGVVWVWVFLGPVCHAMGGDGPISCNGSANVSAVSTDCIAIALPTKVV